MPTLWLVPLLPLAGAAVLLATRGELGQRTVTLIGVGSVGLAALVSIGAAAAFLPNVSDGASRAASLGGWMTAGGFSADLGLRLDALSLVMILVITIVGFLIHWYSTAYMAQEPGYSRFFAYMNLFMAAMLVLVLADNLLLLYLGWEGVGLCSYLLIGFWYRDAANGYAARKAFVVTRVGDAAMLIGLILIAVSLGTLDIQTLTQRATEQWSPGSGIAVAAAALLLAGALGKSAQLPLQTWLPDAMAGPTPVSALIHAATMVTAGMYLIARTHELFVLAPPVQLAVAVIGALTLLLAAGSALAQTDIKRVLAYSTMSQIGYMFLALGAGAWSAAVFHFMTHAFFKALLFLAAGALILAMHHEQNIFRMGGLRTRLPAVFWAFVIGGAALASVPVVTSGFYSKEQILAGALGAPVGGAWLLIAGLAAAFLTSVYIFRVIFIVFFGAPGAQAGSEAADGGRRAAGDEPAAGAHAPRPHRMPYAMLVPLLVLSVLSLVGGFVETPAALGHVTLFSGLLETALPAGAHGAEGAAAELALQIGAAVVSLAGIGLAYWLFFPRRARRARGAEAVRRASATGAARAAAGGWGFDRFYELAVTRPFVSLAGWLRADRIDALVAGVAAAMTGLWRAARLSQTGRLRWYATVMLAGLVVVVAVSLVP